MKVVSVVKGSVLWLACAAALGCGPSGSVGYGPVGVWDASPDGTADSGQGDADLGDSGAADSNLGDAGARTDIVPGDGQLADGASADVAPTDGAATDAAAGETTENDVVQPDTTQPDTVLTDTSKPDTIQPDSTQPDTTAPDVKPDVVADVPPDTAPDVKPDIAPDVAPDVIKDTADIPTINTCGPGKDIKSLLACTEGTVDFYLEKQVVTYLFGQGFLLYDASISRGMMVYLNPNTVTKPKVGDLINLHVTKFATYNGQQEITGADALTVIGTGDAAGANLSLNTISKDMVGEAYESRTVVGTGLKVKQLSGFDGVIVAGGAGDQVLRIDGASTLCVGATFDLKIGAITQFGTSHRIHLLNGAADLGNINVGTCGAAPVYDQSNWGFEEVSDSDPPPDFTKVGAALTAVRTTQLKKAGQAACKLTWTSADNQDFIAGQFIAVQPGQKASVSAWFLDSDPAGRGRVSMTFYKADQVTVVSSQFSTTYTADGADWVQVGFAYTVPAEAAFVRGFVRLYDVPPAFAGTATIYVDDWTTLVL